MFEKAITALLVFFAKPASAQAPLVPQIPGRDYAELKDLDTVVGNLVEVVLALGGLACFAYILIGGFQYLNSAGDDKALMKAKGTLTYAVAGLVMVVLSYAFIYTVFDQTLGFGPIEFTLPQ